MRDDGGRLGSRDRRRDRARRRPRSSRALPDDLLRRDRRAPPAALEPQQPDRPRGRRDPRHDSRGARARRAPSRDRRDRVPRPRHPVEPGAARCARAASIPITASSASSRTTSVRTRASRRPRPTSRTRPASRSSPRPSSRSPTPDNPGPGDRPRDRPALLRVREPRGHRARAPLALRALPPDARARLTPAAGRRPSPRSSRSPARLCLVARRAAPIPSRPRDRGAAAPAPRARDAAVVAAPGADACSSRRSRPANLQRAARGDRRARSTSCVAVDGAGGARSRASARPAARRRVDAEAPRRGGGARGARPATPLRRPARSPTRRSATGRSTATSSIVGGGDPVLIDVERAEHARPRRTRRSPRSPTRSSRAGVRRVDGALVADDSRYDRARAVPDWKPSYVAEGDVGALGALIVNGGRGDNGHRGRRPRARHGAAARDAARGARRADRRRRDRSRRGAAPARRARSRASSRRRSPTIVEQMLTVSNDETAELLTRELGVARARRAAPPRAGHARDPGRARAARACRSTGVVLHDGSGLAPDDRVTCAALLGVVELGGAAEVRGDRSTGSRSPGGPERWSAASAGPRSPAGCGPRPATSTASSAWPGSSTPTAVGPTAEPHASRSSPTATSRPRRARACKIRSRRGDRPVPRRARPAAIWCRRRADRLEPTIRPRGPVASRPERRDETRTPDPNWRRVADNPQQTVRELKDLVIAYAKQEATDPLKGLGRYVGFGLGGALLHRHRVSLPRDRPAARAAGAIAAGSCTATGRGCRTRS